MIGILRLGDCGNLNETRRTDPKYGGARFGNASNRSTGVKDYLTDKTRILLLFNFLKCTVATFQYVSHGALLLLSPIPDFLDMLKVPYYWDPGILVDLQGVIKIKSGLFRHLSIESPAYDKLPADKH
jgi:hypothetical protein